MKGKGMPIQGLFRTVRSHRAMPAGTVGGFPRPAAA